MMAMPGTKGPPSRCFIMGSCTCNRDDNIRQCSRAERCWRAILGVVRSTCRDVKLDLRSKGLSSLMVHACMRACTSLTCMHDSNALALKHANVAAQQSSRLHTYIHNREPKPSSLPAFEDCNHRQWHMKLTASCWIRNIFPSSNMMVMPASGNGSKTSTLSLHASCMRNVRQLLPGCNRRNCQHRQCWTCLVQMQ